MLLDTLINEDGDPEQIYRIDLEQDNIGLKRGTVKLAEHDPAWELSADRFIAHLREILGSVCVDAAHVGSTAVKSIPAKPIIDIALGVSSFEELTQMNEVLGMNGIICRGEDHPGQMLYVCGDLEGDIITRHIHAVIHGGEAWNNYLKLTGYLNHNPADVQAYALLKHRLAETYPGDRAAYTAGKAEFIAELLRRA